MDNVVIFPNKNHKMLEFTTETGEVYYIDFNNRKAINKFFSLCLPLKTTLAYTYNKEFINFNEEGVVKK